MAIHHAVSGELISVAPLAAPLGDSQSTTLVLDSHLKVLRLALPAGKQLPEHAVAGPITLYCLDGAVEVVCGGERKAMHAGDLMYIAGEVAHSLRATADSAMLLSIVIKEHSG